MEPTGRICEHKMDYYQMPRIKIGQTTNKKRILPNVKTAAIAFIGTEGKKKKRTPMATEEARATRREFLFRQRSI